MEIKNYIIMAVSVVTAVVVFGAVLPVFADTTQANDTFTNDGYYDMRYADATTDVLITWDAQDPRKITVNDDVIDLPTIPASRRTTIVAGDSFIIRYYDDRIQWTTTGGSSYITEDATFTASGGNCNMSWGETSVDRTYTSLYIPSSNGPLVMKKYDEPAYMNADSEFVAIGTSDIGTDNVGIKIIGSIEDGATITTWKSPGNATWTFSNIVINSTPVDTHKDLYELSTITADAVNDATTPQSGTITYSYYMVPLEITAERSIHPEGATKVLMDLLPVLIGAGLLLGVAGYVIKRRM